MRAFGAVALALLVLEVLLLEWLLPIDQAVWLLVLLARGCTTDGTVDQLVESAGTAMGVLAVAAALLHVRRRGWTATWPYVALVGLGAWGNAVLKVVLSRERPSNLPGVTDGHAFPSGHVMTTLLAAVLVLGVAVSFRRPWLWRAIAVTLVSIVAAGRVLYGAHWILDVVGAILTVAALAGLGLPAFRRRPLLAPAVLALALVLTMGVHAFVPDAVVRLPSPLTAPSAPLLDIELGAAATSGQLSGGWHDRGAENPAGGLAWVRGVGGVSVFETTWAAEADVPDAPADPPHAGAGELLVMVARPDKEAICRQVRLAVNGNIVAAFVPFVGWREYRIPLPDGTYRRGFNELQIAVREPDGPPARLAVSRLRLRLR